MDRSSQQLISIDTEIRNLPVSIIQNIAQLLAGDDTVLGLLMGNIVSDVNDPNSGLRFTSGDIDLIRHRHQSTLDQISLLFDEWGTMGRNRPRVRHLLNLLIRCQLFRAADFVAQLLNDPKPARPTAGPAALVDISLSDVEVLVNGLDYPSSGELLNLNQATAKPEAIAPNMNFTRESSNIDNNLMPLIPIPKSSKIFMNGSGQLSDLNSNMKKREKAVESPAPAPQISELFIPAISSLQTPDPPIPITVNSTEHSINMPALSNLMINQHSGDQQSNGLPIVHPSYAHPSEHPNHPAESHESEACTPAFSAIFNGETSQKAVNRSSSQSSSSETDYSDEDDNENTKSHEHR